MIQAGINPAVLVVSPFEFPLATQSGPPRSPIANGLSEAPIVPASDEIIIAEWPRKREPTLTPSANKRWNSVPQADAAFNQTLLIHVAL